MVGVKGVVKLRQKSRKAIDLAKGKISEFRESQGKRNDCWLFSQVSKRKISG
jgi:hypothetical protein